MQGILQHPPASSRAQPQTLLSWAFPAAPHHPGHHCPHTSVSVALFEVPWVVMGAELPFLPRSGCAARYGHGCARSRIGAVIPSRRQRWIRSLQLVLLPS